MTTQINALAIAAQEYLPISYSPESESLFNLIETIRLLINNNPESTAALAKAYAPLASSATPEVADFFAFLSTID